MGKVLGVLFGLALGASILAGVDEIPVLAATGEAARALIDEGVTLLAKEPAKAAGLFRKALTHEPQNGEAQFDLALALTKTGDLAEVEALLLAARDDGYDGDEVDAALAEYYVEQAKYGKVLDEFQEGHRRRDLEARIRVARGYAELNLKQSDEAAKAFRRGIEEGEAGLAERVGETEAALRRGIAHARTGLAQTRILAGDLKGATDLLQQATDADPKVADPWILLGRLRALEGDTVGARADYDKALALVPDSMAALFSRASLLVDLNDLKHAIDDVQAMLDQQPDNWRANLLYGIIKARQGQWQDAEAALMAIPAPEQLPDTLLTLATVNLGQGQLAQAESNISRYLSIVPNDPRALGVKAAVLSARGKPAAAIDLLTKSLVTAPDNSSLLGLLVDAYLKNGQAKEAATTLDRLSAIAPRDSTTRIQLAQQKIAAGRVDDALDDLAIARAAEPLSPKPTTATIETLIAANRLDDASAQVEALRQQSPDSAVSETYLGVIDVRRNRLDDARGHFQKALAAQPDFTIAAIDLAQAFRAENRLDEARSTFDHALERSPKSIPVMLARADLETADKKPEAALSFLERARAADPQASDPRFRLVRVYLERKEPAKAVAVAYELERAAPRDANAITALAEAQLANGDRETAIGTFNRIIDMTAGAPAPYLRLAGVFANSGDVLGGYQVMRKALRANLADRRVQDAMLEYSQKTNMAGAGADYVRDLQRERPDDANLDLLVGELYEADRKFERAETAYRQGFAKRASGDLLLGIARAEAQGLHPEAALTTLATWLDGHASDDDARLLYANLLANTKQADKAIVEAERVLAVNGKNSIVLNNLAWLYWTIGDKRALELAEQAYAISPELPAINDTLGWILFQSGETERSLTLLRQAAATSLKPTARYHYALALTKTGHSDEARQILTKLLQPGVEFDDVEAARDLMAKLGS